MNNKEILEKAFLLSIDRGWSGKGVGTTATEIKQTIGFFEPEYLYGYIFNHNFAKALWSETTDYMTYKLGYPDQPPTADFFTNGWKYHLQQMVISDDPIKYLGENI